MSFSKSCILAGLLALVSVPAFSSGSGGYGGGGFSGSTQQRKTDPAYEYGKAVFKGRLKPYRKMKFCTVSEKSDSGVAKVKSKTMKPFKHSTYQAVADSLRNCAKPEQTAQEVLKRDDLYALVYYIDKRFKLKLN